MTAVRADASNSFINLMDSERKKLGSLPALWIVATATFLTAGASAWLFSATFLDRPQADRLDMLDIALRSIDYVQAGLLVLGVIAITSEYPRTIPTTLVANPKRVRVYIAKVIALGVYSIPIAAVAVAIVLIITGIVLNDAANVGDLGDMALRDLIGRLASTIVYLAFIVPLLAFAVGTLLRRTLTGTASVLGYFFIAGPLLRQYAHLNWTPDAVIQTVLFPADTAVYFDISSSWLILSAWTLTLLTASAAAFKLRDA